jgi:hypothetical protein
MICPFCFVRYAGEIMEAPTVNSDSRGTYWKLKLRECPECHEVNVTLEFYSPSITGAGIFCNKEILLYPRTGSRHSCSHEVPKEFADDYNEACLILDLSPKASAALGRRCLQHVLREKGEVTHGKLFNEIEEILSRKILPSNITESLHATRVIGNIAAHATDNVNSGDVMPVEVGEAEWILDTLEGLFDYYFISPAKTAQRKDAYNKKLEAAGKSPIK